VDLRPTAAEDLPALYDVFRAAMEELFARQGLEAPGAPPEVFVAQQGHVLRHDRERCHVAEQDGKVVGFVAALARGGDWFLSSLFVVPEHQGAGLGTELLERAWGDFPRRRTLTDAVQPVSNGLYGRRGLIPSTPALHLGGSPTIHARDAPALEPAEPGPEALLTLDLAAYGFDRAVDHAYWAGSARCTVWLREGEPAAYAYVFPGGRIGPLAGRTPEDASAALRAELLRIRGEVALVVPGSARGLVSAALQAGLRFVRVPGLLLLSDGVDAPGALALSGYTLL
jgi:GNAT superfamily N-acetyltransferase